MDMAFLLPSRQMRGDSSAQSGDCSVETRGNCRSNPELKEVTADWVEIRRRDESSGNVDVFARTVDETARIIGEVAPIALTDRLESVEV